MRFGDRQVVGFGVGDVSIEEVLKNTDPLYACHNDTYTKLKTVGTVVATAAITAGVVMWLSSPIRSGYATKEK